MADTNPITDPRILSILQGGESFKRTIDPDGIIRNGFIREIRRDGIPFSEDADWRARVEFGSGVSFLIRGGWKERSMVLEGGTLIYEKEPHIDIPFKPAATLLAAVGELSLLPVQLKRILAAPGRKKPGNEGSPAEWGSKIFSNEWSSLLWRIERESVSVEQMERFRSVVVRYTSEGSVFPSSVELATMCEMGGCKITVSCGVDVYGLSRKMVDVERNLGNGAHIRCECTRTTEDHQVVPSLDVAFDVVEFFEDSVHVKQRKEKISRGKPKGMFKN